MILRSLHLFVLMAAVLVAPGPSVHADAAAELDRQLARTPAEVATTSGRSVRGILDGYRDGRLHLRLATDGGEVGYSFAPAEIARLTLPGLELEADALELLDRGDLARAMPLLEAIGRHRIRYLAVLDVPQQRCLWLLVEHGAGSGDPHAVLAVVRAMAPIADTPEKQVRLLTAELEIALRTHADAEARELAGRWCLAADPAGGSALGWRVLAGLAYEAGDYEHARWLALQPVTFAGNLPMRDLDMCYALAVATADRLGDTAHAHALHRELAARHIAWPADPTFAGLDSHYRAAAERPTAPFFAPAASAPAPPTDQEARTFDLVRKLPLSSDPH